MQVIKRHQKLNQPLTQFLLWKVNTVCPFNGLCHVTSFTIPNDNADVATPLHPGVFILNYERMHHFRNQFLLLMRRSPCPVSLTSKSDFLQDILLFLNSVSDKKGRTKGTLPNLLQYFVLLHF
uniref:Uncharacterized protein n=1 Tax=Opuntia streptacantha TaxID=393608 RepID=A0A7C9E9X7_OPUST